MTFIRRFSPSVIAALSLVFSLSILACAKEKNPSFPNVKISNFGQLDERFYRGARPKPEDLQQLAALGINTIIDLTDNSLKREKPAVEAAGMRYVNIPIVDKTNPSAAQIDEFLKLVNDPNTGKFYVHCAGGRHRTGVMAAIYRFNNDKWNFDQAYAEMKKFDFYTSHGHGGQLEFIQDYWRQFEANQGGEKADGGTQKAVTTR